MSNERYRIKLTPRLSARAGIRAALFAVLLPVACGPDGSMGDTDGVATETDTSQDTSSGNNNEPFVLEDCLPSPDCEMYDHLGWEFEGLRCSADLILAGGPGFIQADQNIGPDPDGNLSNIVILDGGQEAIVQHVPYQDRNGEELIGATFETPEKCAVSAPDCEGDDCLWDPSFLKNCQTYPMQSCDEVAL